ncbi:aldehyde dehydrogenase family protein [Pseudomonas capeferrum]|uniref:aldehyde dehydrogenase family protein n=1 Tax=Pseudomonas capeferrum TaxID=1495066 RepID=UPI0015E493A3|nr:aldehyde dehydrogenase family protein [Pseudomonas capeferrum]MBA1204379.1 aldehyde dehydrogenase family protein [Pseudomonas capeferrum]
MSHSLSFFIDGSWVAPATLRVFPVYDPAREMPFAQIAFGSTADVDHAVRAAAAAFPSFSQTSREERLALFERILCCFRERAEQMAHVISRELGAPLFFSRTVQVASAEAQILQYIKTLGAYEFETQKGSTRIIREAIGVAALITPWNWPINQIVCKVLPALAAGCTMVLKPSEETPLSALLFAQILQAAGVPRGVFNLVNGEGAEVGAALVSHPLVDMVSFTGSTRAGIAVAKLAAEGVKRVCQELGGKSANILLPDVHIADAARRGALACFANSGQTCDAPTRMLVPRQRMQEAIEGAQAAANAVRAADPRDPESVIGPVVSRRQFDSIQRLINLGIEEGGQLVAGGPGRPEGLDQGWYVQPTVFANVTPQMTLAREEVFGPVLVLMAYDDIDEAIAMANDSEFGLAAYVQSSCLDTARHVARRLRAGTVYINDPEWDLTAPFGGYKQSGNGREYAEYGLNEFLEIKAMLGHG